MREVKFRFWDGNEMWHSIFKLHSDGQVESPRNLNAIYGIEILMQYTGLKDCEGTEIYEGDIVRSDHFVDVEGVQHYVHHTCEWSDKYSGWYFRNNSESFDGDGGLQAFVMMKFLSERNIKVIGNIHQNPELLPTDTSSR